MPTKRKKIDWAKYEKGLRQRGSITFWFCDDAIAQWHPEPGGKRGGQCRGPRSSILRRVGETIDGGETGWIFKTCLNWSLRKTRQTC